METCRFVCRDIGYGVETGEVELPALDGPDWTGKRPYRTTNGITVYLFDDELDKETSYLSDLLAWAEKQGDED